MLVDAHAHLGDGAFDADRGAVLARARAAGVGHVIVIGTTAEDSARAIALARATPGLSATAGLHPHEAKDWSPEVETRLRALLGAPEVVAVGETGLDYHYHHSARDIQCEAFEAQLALGVELGKPVVVHSREADADTAALVREWGPKVPIVLHSFTGGRDLFAAGIEAGAYFSCSGMITFKNWRPEIPLSDYPPIRLLVETDAPYLAPVPHRGRRNEPAFVREVAAALARSIGEPEGMVGQRTTANATRLFGPRIAHSLTETPAP